MENINDCIAAGRKNQNGIHANAVRAAFDRLDLEQDFLEMRNAICMTCGRVGSKAATPAREIICLPKILLFLKILLTDEGCICIIFFM